MNKKSAAGFTLIELMIVVVIIAILATVAWPSFQNYLRQTRLERARTDLMASAQLMERYYTQCRSFTADASAAAPCNALPDMVNQNSADFFTISVRANATGNHYTLLATPVSGKSESRELRLNTDNTLVLCDTPASSAACKPY